MKRAVLFDVGDTLILGHPKLWLWPLLQERGIAGKADVSRLREATKAAYVVYDHHHMAATTIEEALPLWKAFHRTLLSGIGLGEYAEEISGYLNQNWQSPQVWPITPGAKEVLFELRSKGYKLGVVSNWDAILPEVLKATGLAQHFDFVAASALVGFAKPDPRIFELVLEELGVAPSEAIHVGDSMSDINGARAAGVEPIWFDPYKQNLKAIHDLREVLSRV